jgi:hypothetical protein
MMEYDDLLDADFHDGEYDFDDNVHGDVMDIYCPRLKPGDSNEAEAEVDIHDD